MHECLGDRWRQDWREAWFAALNERTDCRASSPFVRPLPHHCWSSGHPPTFCAENRETSVTAAVASCLLVLDLIRKAVFTNSLWWTFLANGLITQQKQHWFMFGNEEVDSGWSAPLLKRKNLPDVQLLELTGENQIVFSPGNFLSDNCWPTAKNSSESEKTCLVHRPGLYPDTLEARRAYIRKMTRSLPYFLY